MKSDPEKSDSPDVISKIGSNSDSSKKRKGRKLRITHTATSVRGRRGESSRKSGDSICSKNSKVTRTRLSRISRRVSHSRSKNVRTRKKSKKPRKPKKPQVNRPNKFDREVRFMIGGCRLMIKERIHVNTRSVPEDAQLEVSNAITNIRDVLFKLISAKITPDGEIDFKTVADLLGLTANHYEICMNAMEVQKGGKGQPKS